MKMDKDKMKSKNVKIELELFNTEIIQREVSRFGTGAHVIVPKEYAGKKVKVIILDSIDEKKEEENG